MILKPDQNKLVSVASFTADAAMLQKFKDWSDNQTATAVDLYNFMKKASDRRSEFIYTLNYNVTAEVKYVQPVIS